MKINKKNNLFFFLNKENRNFFGSIIRVGRIGKISAEILFSQNGVEFTQNLCFHRIDAEFLQNFCDHRTFGIIEVLQKLLI
jgi:Holliday junction resolvasome RuvABC DNA-binding subunit